MAATTTEKWIEELKGISVLELSERIKALEEEFGVSATAVAAAAPAAGGGGGGAGGRGRVLDRRRDPHRCGRQEGPRHQGRPCGHGPGPQGGKGSRGRRSAARQGGHRARRGGEAQGRPRRSRRHRRAEVNVQAPSGATLRARPVLYIHRSRLFPRTLARVRTHSTI